MKKEQMVGTRLPQDLVRDLELIEREEQSDRSATVRRLLYKAIAAWKIGHYAKLYADGRLTLARAAREAGVPVWQMMDYARQNRIAVQYDSEDLERDAAAILARRKTSGPSARKPA